MACMTFQSLWRAVFGTSAGMGDWLDNPELDQLRFHFGTRPLLTQESPVSAEWKEKILTLNEGDIVLNRFSPTGFYSSAVKNDFLKEFIEKSSHQVAYTLSPVGEHIANSKRVHGDDWSI